MKRSSGSSNPSALDRFELELLREMVVGEEDLPEDKVGMRHEIGDPLEHAPGFENECWECDL